MAKKTSKKVFDIDSFDTFLAKEANTDGAAIGKFKKKREWISTGIYILNAMLSTHMLEGGISANRVTGIGGLSGTGKTFLALNIARNALSSGYERVFYIDTEGAMDLELAQSFGIDVSSSKFRREPIATVEKLKVYLAKFIDKIKSAKEAGEEIPKFLIIIDSLGNLASRKEVDDAVAGENKADMQRAKTLKSIFRIVTADLEALNIPMLVLNHTYMTQEVYPREIFSGGEGGIFCCSTIGLLSKAKLKGEDMDEMDLGATGIVVTAKAIKNRFAKPKKVKFEIPTNERPNKYKGLEFFCTVENYSKVGIAKGKKTVDEETGEITVKEGGVMYYVRHLDKHLYEKQLFNSKVFTDDVLKELDKIAHEYFRYKSQDELEEIESQLDEMRIGLEDSEETANLSSDDLNADTLFN